MDDEIWINIFYAPTCFYNRQETVGGINHRLYFVANTTSRCEFRLKYNLWLNLVLVFYGFTNIVQTHLNPEVQPMVEFRVSFIRVTKRGQMFLQPDIFSHTSENNGHIQPQVVLLCEHNITMRIYTKIQLVVELNIVFFYGFINVIQTHPKPEVQPVVLMGTTFQVLMCWSIGL